MKPRGPHTELLLRHLQLPFEGVGRGQRHGIAARAQANWWHCKNWESVWELGVALFCEYEGSKLSDLENGGVPSPSLDYPTRIDQQGLS